MLLRGVYETALYFGFSYDTPEERFFILCLLEASVSRGEQWAENNARVDRLIYTLVQKKELTVSEEDLEAQIQAAGNAFSLDMLAANLSRAFRWWEPSAAFPIRSAGSRS